MAHAQKVAPMYLYLVHYDNGLSYEDHDHYHISAHPSRKEAKQAAKQYIEKHTKDNFYHKITTIEVQRVRLGKPFDTAKVLDRFDGTGKQLTVFKETR